MIKYQYHYISSLIRDSDSIGSWINTTTELNELGAEGWDVVTITPDSSNVVGSFLNIVLRRPYIDE
jgi:hypothetical protein